MFPSILKLFKKTPVVQKAQYYAVALDIRHGAIIPVGATPMEPPDSEIASEIQVRSNRICMYEFASDEYTAMFNASKRALNDARDEINAAITSQIMKQPATKQDIEDLRNEIANLREIVSL